MSQASAPQKQQAEDSGPLEMPEVSHRQTLKLIGSLMFCLVIQMPIAIRKVFMLKRSRNIVVGFPLERVSPSFYLPILSHVVGGEIFFIPRGK